MRVKPVRCRARPFGLRGLPPAPPQRFFDLNDDPNLVSCITIRSPFCLMLLRLCLQPKRT